MTLQINSDDDGIEQNASVVSQVCYYPQLLLPVYPCHMVK